MASRGQPPISRLTDIRRGPVPVLVPDHARAVGLACGPARGQACVRIPARDHSSRFKRAPARRPRDQSKDMDSNPGFSPDLDPAPICGPAKDDPRPEDQGCPVVRPGPGARRGPSIALRVARPGRRQNHSCLVRTGTGRPTTGIPGHNTDRGRRGTEETIGPGATVCLEMIGAAVRLAIRAAYDAQRREPGPVLAGRGISRGPTATHQSRPPNS